VREIRLVLTQEKAMNSIGIDLHKHSITMCVMSPERQVLKRQQIGCKDTELIGAFFRQWRPFEAVIEATASYEWLYQLLEPIARRIVLAHPKKLRIIAESKRKSDKLDAQVLAELLACDMIPTASRPSPRQREHRRLVRHREYLRRRLTAVRCKIRRILADTNADRPDLFTACGMVFLAKVRVSASDRFVLDQLTAEWKTLVGQMAALTKHLRAFARTAPPAEAEARAVMHSIPYVGPVTVDAVVSELGDVNRFRSQKRVAAYAGLAPGQRESAGRRRELGITKEGSPLLRWAMIQTAWRLVQRTQRWRTVFEALTKRRGAKRAITAVARRVLCMIVALMKSGRRYQAAVT
jgi:transposase